MPDDATRDHWPLDADGDRKMVSWGLTGRRRRIPVELPLTLGTALDGPRQVATTVNANPGGLFVQSAALFPVNTPLWVDLTLPVRGETRLLTAVVQVRWINNPIAPKADALPPGMGIEFLGLDPRMRADFDAFLRARLPVPAVRQ